MGTGISVIIPLYNKAAYVTRCLESIRNQSFVDFEALVVDDGSTDDSAAIATRVSDPRFRVIRQKNGGEGAARNRGIREARGELVAFLDADDEWNPEFLAAIAELRNVHAEAGILATGYRRWLSGGEAMEITLLSGQRALIRDYFRFALEGNFVTSSSVAVPCHVFKEIGLFAEGEPIGCDIDLWGRIALRYPVACDARPLAIYHSEAEGRSFSRWRENVPYPVVVRSLRKARHAGQWDPARHSEIAAYIDTRLIAQAWWMVALRDRRHLLEFLSAEQFETPRARREARILRAAASLVPLNLVNAFKVRVIDRLHKVERQDLMIRRAFAHPIQSTPQ